MRKIERIILHCSGNSNPKRTAEDERQWHIKGRGFKDIGYHFFIRTDGTLEKGRELEVVGAHCEGYNATSIGLCLNGLKLTDFKEVQFQSLEKILWELRSTCPAASIHPHHALEFRGKTCPVFDVRRFADLWSRP